jgi:spore maturation protein CgeB
VRLRLVVLGLTLTSAWGNGHATTYRALIQALHRRGHDVLFLEADRPWYARHRDLPQPPWAQLSLYRDREELRIRHGDAVRHADAVLVGSYVPEGARILDWVLATATGPVAFYDIDTPVTLAALTADACEYLRRDQVPRLGAYFSFTGGPAIERLRNGFGARHAWPLYCAVDPDVHHPTPLEPDLDLGYLGTYSLDRQPALERLLLEPARRWQPGKFVVAGAQYPPDLPWPRNVTRLEHVPPSEHAPFYARQRFTLNLTRADMVRAGWSPSVRLFEAAACGTPLLTDPWPGLAAFFEPGREILTVQEPTEVLALLKDLPESDRRRLGAAARRRVLAEHTADRRAQELEGHLRVLLEDPVTPHVP